MKNDDIIRVAHIMGKMNSGGVESLVMNYYRNIDKDKIQFDFIIDSDSNIPQYKEIIDMGGKIIKISPYQNFFSYIKDLKKIFKKNEYKIVHSHLNVLSVFPLAVAKFCKVPVRIAHSHSTSNKKEWKKNIMKCILKPFSKVFATDFFACTEHAGKWLFGNKFLENGKIKIINNALEIDKFKFNEEVRNKIRKKLNIEDKFVVGHVGRFVKQKNHEMLVDIFYEVHKEKENAILMLIGEGPLEDKIKKKVKQLNLEKNVIFLGIKDNVNELMQTMDVFVFPSLYEGLGIAVIEAQISGLKCICSSEVPTAAKLTDKIEFFDLNDSLSIWKNEILKQRKDRIKYDDIFKKCGYDITTEAQKLEKIYQELEKKNEYN